MVPAVMQLATWQVWGVGGGAGGGGEAGASLGFAWGHSDHMFIPQSPHTRFPQCLEHSSPIFWANFLTGLSDPFTASPQNPS